jgi:hypothetical protein
MFKDYEKWTKQEDDQLNRLYNGDMLDIMEISKLMHNRSPYGIAVKLLEKKYISTFVSARGYSVYITTSVYIKHMMELLNGGTAYSN